mgnify:CR=1 FL=1
MVLARGLVGSDGEEPKVACPLHKKQFDLSSGKEINGGDLEIVTFEAKVEGGRMMLHLPPRDEVDAVLALLEAAAYHQPPRLDLIAQGREDPRPLVQWSAARLGLAETHRTP